MGGGKYPGPKVVPLYFTDVSKQGPYPGGQITKIKTVARMLNAEFVVLVKTRRRTGEYIRFEAVNFFCEAKTKTDSDSAYQHYHK